MSAKQQLIAYQTIVRTEVKRIMRIWSQTLLPPAITSTLYFVIFGQVVGSRVGVMGGYEYIQFIAPGLIMMNIISSAYACSVSGFFGAKMQHNIEEILVAPVSNVTLLLGFMSTGVLRAIIVGAIVSLIAMFFTHLHLYSLPAIITAAILAACIFSLAGIINAIFAKTFDGIAFIPNFVLTPLTYLGGVFYSIKLLPTSWQYVSFVNPIVYIIDSFRYGFLGINHGHLLLSYGLMIGFIVLLFALGYYFIYHGTGLRS